VGIRWRASIPEVDRKALVEGIKIVVRGEEMLPLTGELFT
jgi:hypothetical protein